MVYNKDIIRKQLCLTEDSMKKYFRIAFAILSALALGLFYNDWLIGKSSPELQEILISLLAAILFYVCLQFVFSKLYDFFSTREQSSLLFITNDTRKKAWMTILFWMAISRIVLYALAFLFSGINGRWGDTFFDTMQSIWTGNTDANSYLGIAEHWYVTEGDSRFHIVFFPLYPILIKLFQLVLQNYFVSALVVSNLCAFGAAIFLYELAALDMPSQKALNTVKYLFLLPAAIFFAAPMTESLFLLLSVACIYFVRKRHYLPACLLGALASFTRSPGVLLLALIFIEFVRDLIDQYHKDGNRFRSSFWKQFLGRGFCMLIIPLGLLGYLLINYLVTGNPFQFSIYQDQHWHQRFGYFFSTASIQFNQILTCIKDAAAQTVGAVHKILGLWGTNVFCFFSSLGLMIAAAKKVRPSYSVYYLVYFAITMGVTWLLSAPRYLVVAFPLAFAITALVKGKWADRIVTLLLFVLQLCYLAMFMARGFHIY